MDAIKKILKFIGAMAIGMAVGLGLCIAGIALFTEMPLFEFFDKFASLDIQKIFHSLVVGIGVGFLSLTLLITLHELGHLIAGLLSGYRFVSFRIFSYILIRENDHFKIKKFGIAGTSGQCLLDPPATEIDRLPVFWYNAGGVLVNLIIFLALLPLMWVEMHPLLKEALFVFLLVDALLILLNGIPLKPFITANDASNILLLRKSPLSRLALVSQLKGIMLIQQGVRPKDLPTEYYPETERIDYTNHLEVAIPMMRGSIAIDKGDVVEARRIYEELYRHKSSIMPLYVNEIACELIWLRLLEGDIEEASVLLDDKLKVYIGNAAKMQSSKQRILCAIALLIEKDRDKAISIYRDLSEKRSEYLLAGEVESDLALLHPLISDH